MKNNNFLKRLYNKYKHHSAEEIEQMVDAFVVYSTLISIEENSLHKPFLTQEFVDYSRQVAQRSVYNILQTDSALDMFRSQQEALKNFNEYFVANFEYSQNLYLKVYNNIERAIDRSKTDDNKKFELHYKVSVPHEKTTAKINSLRQGLDQNYLMIDNSTINTQNRFM